MTIATITAALKRLRPGDTYVLPDGDILGNVHLPRGLSGAKGAVIRIKGGEATRIIATDKTRAAFSGGGCRYLDVSGFTTVGGLNGVQFSQNGMDYDPAKVISDIHAHHITALNPVDDCFKFNGGYRCHLSDFVARGGRDQLVDFLGIDQGSIRRGDMADALVGIVLKGGSRRISVVANTIARVLDGLRIGDPGDPRYYMPGSTEPASVATVKRNDISVSASPIVVWKSPSVDSSKFAEMNTLTTTHRSKGQPGAPVRIVA